MISRSQRCEIIIIKRNQGAVAFFVGMGAWDMMLGGVCNRWVLVVIRLAFGCGVKDFGCVVLVVCMHSGGSAWLG